MRYSSDTSLWKHYQFRILLCLVASLLILLGAFTLWPVTDKAPPNIVFNTHGQDRIQLEDVQQTRQSKRPPAPPVPPVPVLIPNEEELQDIQLDVSENFLALDDPGTDDEFVEGDDEGGESSVAAEVGPKTVRFVEPEYTREARKRNIRAELVVEVLVDERGHVANSKILERFLLSKDSEEKERVERLGYGLEESVLSATERWLFRPARQNGKPVKSYTTLTFTLGV